MKDNNDIIKIWQEASRKIEENNRLTRSIIEKAIKSKSQDVMSQFTREKLAGLISGLIFIPIIITGFFISFNVNFWSILFACILGLALVWGVIDGIAQLRKIKAMDQSDSLADSLVAKIDYLKLQFNRAQWLSPLLGICIYLPLIIIYRYLEYGNLDMEKIDIIVLVVSLSVILLITTLLVLFQKRKYIAPLKECYNELESLEPPLSNTRPRINLAVVLAVFLLISMIIYWVATR